MSDLFNYKQRPATPAYRENWERVWGNSLPEVTPSEGRGRPTPVADPRPLPFFQSCKDVQCPACAVPGCPTLAEAR